MTEFPPAGARLAPRLLVLLAALACVVGAFSGRDLWAPDEPRYGQVAREMLASGDWLVPHVNGAPYAEKPPLYFWLAAALSAPGGRVTAITARLAAALLAAGAVWLTARLALRFFRDRWLAACAAAMFASTALVVWNAPRAALDLPLTFFILLSVERATAWWEGQGWTAALSAGVAWAGAVLVKGPVGLFLPPLVLAGAFVAARRAPRLRDPGWWLVPLVMVSLCLAWVLPALEAGGEAYADRLLGQIADRASGAEAGHRRPVTYYALRVGPFLMPWALHALAGFAALFTMRRRPASDRYGLGACAAGGLGLLVVLTTFATKRELYMLPAFPFVAILAAYAVHHGVAPALQRWGRWLAAGGLGLTAVGVAAAPWVVPWAAERRGIDVLAWPDLAGGLPAAAAGFGLLLAAWQAWRLRDRPVRFVYTVAVFVLLAGACLHVALLPLVDPVKSFARAAQAVEAASGGGPIFHAGFGQGPNLLWSLDRERIEEVEDAEGLRHVLAAPGALLAEEGWWRRARERLGDAFPADPTWHGTVGHKRIVVVPGRPGSLRPARSTK